MIEKMIETWNPLHSDVNPFQVWEQIGNEIGWVDYAICKDYIRILKKKNESSALEIDRLSKLLDKSNQYLSVLSVAICGKVDASLDEMLIEFQNK